MVWQWHFGHSVLEKGKHLGPRMCHPVVYCSITYLGKIPGTIWVPLSRGPAGKSWHGHTAQHHAAGEDFRVSCVSGCSWNFLRKASSRFIEELGPFFFFLVKNKTEYSNPTIYHRSVFLWTRGKYGTHTSHLMPGMCVFWRSLGRWVGERIAFFFVRLSFLWTCSKLVSYFCNKKVPKSIKLKKWTFSVMPRAQCLVDGMHATNRSGCCYCWQRVLQVAKVGSKQSWEGAESRWELEPVDYLVSTIRCVIVGQPLPTPSLSLLIRVMGVVIPAPQGSEED